MRDVSHDGIRKKSMEKVISENTERDRMFHMEIQNERGLNHLMDLYLIE